MVKNLSQNKSAKLLAEMPPVHILYLNGQSKALPRKKKWLSTPEFTIEIEKAKNPADALRQIKTGKCDILLVDSWYFEKKASVLSLFPGLPDDIPVIAVTKSNRPQEKLNLLKKGVADVVNRNENDSLSSSIYRIIFLDRGYLKQKIVIETIRERENFAYSTLNALPNQVLVVNDDGTIVYVNQKWHRFAHEHQLDSDIVGENYFRLCEEPQGKWVISGAKTTEGIRSVFAKNKPAYQEELSQTIQGKSFHFLLSVSVFPGAEAHQAVLSLQSLTAGSSVGQLLSQSEEKYRDLVEKAGIAILIDNREGKITYLNRKMEDLFGYRVNELFNQNVEILIHPKDRERVMNVHRKRIQEGPAPVRYNFRGVKKDGSMVYLEVAAVELKEAGRVVGSRSYFWDVTKQTKTTTALKARTSQQESLFRIGKQALVGKDMQSVFQLAVKEVSTTLGLEFVKILQYFPEKKKFLLIAGCGWKKSQIGLALIEDDRKSQAGFTLQSRETVVVTDFESETRFRRPQILEDYRIRSGMSVSIGEPGKPFGVLGAHSRKSRHYTQDELLYLEGMANLLATIVDRWKKQGQLTESEARFHSIVDHSHDGILVADEKFRVIYVNAQLCHMLRAKPEEILQHDFREFLTDESRDMVAERYARRQRGEEVPSTYEFTFQTKDGTVRLTEMKVTTLKDAHGQLTTVAQLLDITERRSAENELKESQDRFKTIFELAPDAYYLHDLQGTFLQVNLASETLTGYSKQELVGKKFSEVGILSESDLQTAGAMLKKSREGLAVEPTELTVIQKNGRKIPVEIRTIPTRIAGEQLVLGIARDIGQRKNAEAQLFRLASVIEQASESIIITDTEGHISYVNQAFEESSGYSFEEVLGENPRILKSGHQPAKFYQELWETIASGKSWHGTFINKRKNGELFYEDAVIFPITGGEGEVINFAAVKRDVTQERKLKEQFHQAQKMEAVGRLAGGVAHDFNNLLSVINGYGEMLLQKLAPDDPNRRDVQQIHKAGNRAGLLTNQLLAFSRRQMIQPVILNLNAIVSETEKMLHRLIGEDVELATVFAPELDNIKIDPGQVEQIILNLAINARDAMPDGGKLTIETSNIVIDENYKKFHVEVKQGNYVMLAVSDTGTGMTKEIREKIFEPFFTTKEQGKGTGLGLSTVYGIMKQNNGYIWVYSEPGLGTSFKLYFPQAAARTAAKRKSIQTIHDLSGDETILVVEDDKMLREMIETGLGEYSYQVLTASSAEEAIALAQKSDGKIDLLLTDVVLPHKRGQELSVEISEVLPDIRTIFMSGYTDTTILHKFVLGSEMNFIQKPFSIPFLLKKIREVMGNK